MRIKDKDALAARIRDSHEFSLEEKTQLLGLLNDEKTYGLVWEDKPEDANELLRTQIPVLREVPSRFIPSDDTEAPNHILIEGDNLHALTALSYAYEGRVDVIYIDPPYNTGHQDFSYNDHYVDRDDSFKHSLWLSFMERRLKIAKRLLSDKGVIFISIDDNEQAELKLLCNQIFGSSHFVADIIWRSSDSSNHDSKQFSADYNNTLVYSKSQDWQPNKISRTEDDNGHYKNPDNDPNGPWFASNLSSPNPRQNLMYDVISPQGVSIHAPKNGWRWSKEKMQQFIDSGAVKFLDNGTRLLKKTYLKDQVGLVPSNIWWDIEVTGHNRNAKYELIKIFFEKKTSEIFKTPKPTKFINRILEISTDKDSVIMDFFAGAGTTMHSVMLLNQEDGGHRQCILVTNNENNICEEVTYERNKRVIKGYTTPKGEHVEGLTANRLRYYQIDFIGRKQNNENRAKLMEASTDVLCMKENLYAEQETFCGLKLPKQAVRYFAEGERRMLIIYNPVVVPHIAKAIAKAKNEPSKIQIYVMSEGQYPYTDDFAEVADRVELHAMPASLYQAYRQVLPPMVQAAEIAEHPDVSEEELDAATTDIFKAEDYD